MHPLTDTKSHYMTFVPLNGIRIWMVDFLHENGICSSSGMMFRMLNCLVIFKEMDCNNEIEKTFGSKTSNRGHNEWSILIYSLLLCICPQTGNSSMVISQRRKFFFKYIWEFLVGLFCLVRFYEEIFAHFFLLLLFLIIEVLSLILTPNLFQSN